MIESLEVLQRTWHVDGQSVRPDHRMVAHTGFLTHARLLAPGDVNFLDLVVLAAAGRGGLDRLSHRASCDESRRGPGSSAASSWRSCSSTTSRKRCVVHRRARGCSARSCSCSLIATIGHAVGYAIGSAVHNRFGGRANPALHTSDRVAGAIVGVTGVLALDVAR